MVGLNHTKKFVFFVDNLTEEVAKDKILLQGFLLF